MTASAALPVVAIAALVLAVFAAAVLLRASARVELRRSVRVHATPRQVWETVGRFPDLHGRHGKARGLGPIEGWSLRQGDGNGSGTVWRATGTLAGAAYWADVEVVRAEAPRVLEVTLKADSLETERGLRAHRGVLTLEPADGGTTKVTWTLQAHLRGLRARLRRLTASGRLHALLLDQGLRSIKGRIEAADDGTGPAATGGPAPGLRASRLPEGTPPGSNRQESSLAP